MLGTAGGITSLISYPALLVVGIAPLQANVTNAVALFGAGLGATIGSQTELREQRPRLTPWLALAAIGGAVGAGLLLSTPAGVFAWLVPFLVATAALLLLAEPRISAWRETRQRPQHPAWVLVGVAAVSAYDGYFGAGAGVMLLALLLVLAEQHLPTANALKNAVLVAADLLPAVIFAFAGPVVWRAAVPLAVGSLAGGTAGPAITRRAPRDLLRILVAASGLVLAAWLFVDAAT